MARNGRAGSGHAVSGDGMVEGARMALANVLSVQRGEKILVIMDEQKRSIGQAFVQGAKALGANALPYYLNEAKRPLQDIPTDLGPMFKDSHVIINTFYSDSQETPFRVKLLYEEIANDARVGHAPGITEDMMTKGPLNVDYHVVRKAADYLMRKFEGAHIVRITAPGGTDVTLDIMGRLFSTDVIIDKGTFGNLPAGEMWCAPVENDANGIIVCDGTIGDIGHVPAPLKMEIRNGRVVALESADRELVDNVKELISVDRMADVIGELGIGLNPGARLVGNMLEDEKAGGTAHIALGNNIDMVRGQNDSATHRDFLFHKPTMEVTFVDGSKRVIIKDGNVL
ncbi:MAG: aminopeptidase [Euryarchaeota archaeon]|nr:aminopeptidase [Euryarchaeota archaeon]